MKTIGELQILKKYDQSAKTIKAIICSVIFFFLLFCFYAEKVNASLSNSMIRLHIVANSNTKEDQSLKYRIRDVVIGHMREQMDDVKSKSDAGNYVKNHIHELESVANQVLEEYGMDEKAKVSFGKFPFPTKQYQNFILPSGFYDAVKIEIGNAEGENWWCVMFPPLCIVDDTTGELDDASMKLLRDELSDEEMDMVLSVSSENEMPVEIKFKIVEIFQGSKIKLAGLFRSIIHLNR